jgi:hypothetical protein
MPNYKIYFSFIWYWFFFKYIIYFTFVAKRNEKTTFFNEFSTKNFKLLNGLRFN